MKYSYLIVAVIVEVIGLLFLFQGKYVESTNAFCIAILARMNAQGLK